ncbi:uncharacterized protein ASPGLDRAFT_47260 [Aspergillus glaucus CBS 516.65]|uniref:Uncharacterized protein n=1 Tax=Aspergillus glaucus CBS 516.65 TaxID=1160497 RepID=A0A1L9VKC1_ASPGL|nr:hypothetical protein ASPGLDRAFT_47260 [Aspergillus glaucus CBS 516.65]OJJ84378.1 hypothetical protein ASPGLDRAFT_47260 [Aspergillus glaucus CBS 516.65]
MAPNAQDSGERYLQSSPCLGSPLGHFAQTPTPMKAEQISGRPEHIPNGSSTEFPYGLMSPMQELPVRMEEAPAAEPARVDPTEWYPHYLICLRHFLDHAQHTLPVQSLATFINIRLPCQRSSYPVFQFTQSEISAASVSLTPYIRRLIVTGNDTPSVLQAFFGNGWEAGIDYIWKQERMNYLFTAKSSGWASTKETYDTLPDEQTPTLRPLRNPTEEELCSADARWSEWLAMEDWMVGPRSPW